MALTPAPTVRESVEAAVSTVLPEQPVTPVETTAPEAAQVEEAKAEAMPSVETPKTDERPRDKDGKFVKVEEKKEAPKAEAAPAAPPKPKLAKPQSWKKELEQHWDALDPLVQANIIEREKQYQTGVSTYKTEADKAKGITTALAQFEPMLQKKGIPTDKWIQQMGIAHYLISEGTPRERVEAVAQIIKNNGIDVNALGQLLAGQQPQYQQPQAQPSVPYPQAPQQPVDIEATVEQALQKREVESAYKAFTADVEAGKYPHFSDDEVKGTMAGLLQSGLAQDYASAYEAAIALPKHRHLVEAEQQQKAQQQATEQAAAKAEQAKRARSQAVSVKSSTPSTMATAPKAKGLRDSLSEAFDSVTASRV